MEEEEAVVESGSVELGDETEFVVVKFDAGGVVKKPGDVVLALELGGAEVAVG